LPGTLRSEAISASRVEGAIQESVGGTDTEQRVPRNKEVPDDMVWIPSGSFWMGGAGLDTPDTQPVHMVTLHGFWMDRHEVTNERFARFVAATEYKPIAERIPDARDFPGAPPENLVAGSVCFVPPDHDVKLDNHYQWWTYIAGADWRHPEGPSSNIEGRE